MKVKLSDRCKVRTNIKEIEDYLNTNIKIPSSRSITNYSNCQVITYKEYKIICKRLIDKLGNEKISIEQLNTRYRHKKVYKTSLLQKKDMIGEWETGYDHPSKWTGVINFTTETIEVKDKRFYKYLKIWGDKNNFKELIKDWC